MSTSCDLSSATRTARSSWAAISGERALRSSLVRSVQEAYGTGDLNAIRVTRPQELQDPPPSALDVLAEQRLLVHTQGAQADGTGADGSAEREDVDAA